MNDDLKPCPFCGGSVVYANTYRNAQYRQYVVKCRKCGARIMGVSIEKAIEKWNRRADPKERTAKVQYQATKMGFSYSCGNCDNHIDNSCVKYCPHCGVRLEWRDE